MGFHVARTGRLILLAGLLAVPAHADLVERAVLRDDPLAHAAAVVDTTRAAAGTGFRSANWTWAAEQKLAIDGRTWVIEVRARHANGPHRGELDEGPHLVARLPGLRPGGSGGATVRADHAERDHADTLTVGYEPMSGGRSRLTIRLEHAGDAPAAPQPARWPAALGTLAALGGAWWLRPAALQPFRPADR